MTNDLKINDFIAIPAHELEITTSRSGGPDGQHVNKSNSKVTVRFNVNNTQAFDPERKERILQRLQSHLTTEGDLIIHSSVSRSQHHNKDDALRRLAEMLRKALHVPKKRMKTTISKEKKEKRLHEKKHHAAIKKMRQKISE